MKNLIISANCLRATASILGAAALALTCAPVAQAQPVITNAPGYVITWDGNDGDNSTSSNVPLNIASASQGAVAFASGQLGPEIGVAFHYVTNLNDGFYGNTKSWIGGTNDPTPWFAGIQLPAAVPLTGIAWGRDNTGVTQDRWIGTYTLQISTNASFTTNSSAWTTLGTITYTTNSAVGFSPWLRHRYQLATTSGAQIMANGVRLLVPDSGLVATGTDIDELELFRSSVTNIAYWRMGENDPGAANGVTNFVTVNLLGSPMALKSNAVYTANVAAAANSTLALQFTTGCYATNQPAFSFTDNFGLELWVKPDATNAIQSIAYNGDSGPNGWGLYLHQGKYQGLFGGLAFLTGPDAVPGVWTHLALVRNNGLTTLYVNGLPAATSLLTPGVPTGRFALAAQAQTLTTEFFAGALDEVRVFTFALGTFSTLDLAVARQAPSVGTLAATGVSSTNATLNGTVSPGNLTTASWFEWGTTTNYGNFTAASTLPTTNLFAVLSNTISGLVGGTTYHYRCAASNAVGFSYGDDQTFFTRAFELTAIPDLPAVWGGSVEWGDYDNDGRLDFLLIGSSGSSPIRFSQLWRNNGDGSFTNVTSTATPGLSGVDYGSVAWGDYDNDGRLDFLLTGSINSPLFGISQLWRNKGDGTFSNVTASVAPGLPGVFQSSVAWGDYDNDGRLDFLITGRTNSTASSVISQLWRNTGSGFTNATASAVPDLPVLFNGAVAWADFDNDGWLDFLLTGFNRGTNFCQLWRNNGNGTLSNVTATVAPGLPGVSSASVAWGDYDKDGRLDLILTGYDIGNAGVCQLWRNTASGFSNVTSQVAPGLPNSGGPVAWGDFDNDGRLDFLLTGSTGSAVVFQLWRNTESGFSNVTSQVAPNVPGVFAAHVAWGDYDNDGRLDFLLTGSTNAIVNTTSQLWHSFVPVTNTPPTAPTGLALTTTAGGALLSWNSATDSQTPASGLTYNVRAGSTPGGIDLLAGHVTATNGFRRVPAMGNASLRHSLPLTGLTNGQTVYWSVQAVDTSFAGGPFASETNFYSAIVTTTADNGAGSLRDAVTHAASPKLITFAPALSGQTITLTSGQLTLSNTVTINGSTLPGGIQIDGNASSRIFEGLSGSVVVLDSLTLTNGRANGGSGGGILNTGNLTVNRCTLVGNRAGFYGGGIENNGSESLVINQSTFMANQCSAEGGAALDISAGPVLMQHCTVVGNVATAAAGQGGVGNYNSGVTIHNSIIAGNSSAGSTPNIGGNPMTFTGVNLTNGTPLLAPLGNYGGPTPTMPPLSGSPAIDAATNGTSFTTDQRGLPRILGAFADLGAVEGVFNPNFPLVNVTQLGSGNVQFAFTNLSGPSYRVLASTNVAAPINTWSNLGAPTESPAGVFTFTDLQAPNYPSRFYRVTTP